MSIQGVRAFVRTRMQALGYTEWNDGFNWRNIPSTLLDQSFHVELNPSVGISNNQDSQDIETQFTVRIFRAPNREPNQLVDTATGLADTVIADLLRASIRTTQVELKNVRFNSMTVEQLDVSNDNGIVVTMVFTALVIISTRG